MYILSLLATPTRREDPILTESRNAVIFTAYTATRNLRSTEVLVTKEDDIVFLSKHGRVLVNKLAEKEAK